MRIFPSLLAADWLHLSTQIQALTAAGVDGLHCDVMDGHFVPNLTFGAHFIAALHHDSKLPLDVHLMITNAEASIHAYIDAGASHITVHLEACTHLHRLLTLIRNAGCTAGVALNPATSPESLAYVAEYLDQVLVMGVNPGFGGQKYIANTTAKIAQLYRLRQHWQAHFRIVIDGGINEQTIHTVAQYGADDVVVGNHLFQAADIGWCVQQLRQNAQVLTVLGQSF